MKIFAVVGLRDGRYGEGTAYVVEETEDSNWVVYDQCLEDINAEGDDYCRIVDNEEYAVELAKQEREWMIETYKDVYDELDTFEANNKNNMYEKVSEY